MRCYRCADLLPLQACHSALHACYSTRSGGGYTKQPAEKITNDPPPLKLRASTPTHHRLPWGRGGPAPAGGRAISPLCQRGRGVHLYYEIVDDQDHWSPTRRSARVQTWQWHGDPDPSAQWLLYSFTSRAWKPWPPAQTPFCPREEARPARAQEASPKAEAQAPAAVDGKTARAGGLRLFVR